MVKLLQLIRKRGINSFSISAHNHSGLQTCLFHILYTLTILRYGEWQENCCTSVSYGANKKGATRAAGHDKLRIRLRSWRRPLPSASVQCKSASPSDPSLRIVDIRPKNAYKVHCLYIADRVSMYTRMFYTERGLLL